MKLLKHQSEDADEMIAREGHRKVSSETAHFLKAAMKAELVFEDEGGIDMWKSIERRDKEKEVTGAIRVLRADGASDETIITKVMSLFNVTRDYVLALLAPKQA